MRTSSRLALAAIALLPSITALAKDKPQLNWVAGTVTEINQTTEQNGWYNDQYGNAIPKTVRYVDYSVQVQNKVYLLRLLPTRKNGVLSWAAAAIYQQSSPNIGTGVGDPIRVAIEGTVGWLEYGRKAYPCSVVRQTLTGPSAEATPAPDAATAPGSDPNARPTLRREQ